MANVELKIVKSSLTPKSLESKDYTFKGVSVGEWNIPATDAQPATVLGYLELNVEDGLPVRLPASSIGFAKIGDKTISEHLGTSNDIIKPSDDLGGVLSVKIASDQRRLLTFKNVTALQMLG